MRIKTIALFAGAAMLATACGPAPGSAEWCKGLVDGSIKPTQQEAMEHGSKCMGVMMEEGLKGLGLN